MLRAVRGLRDDPRAFREACYYETARDETLLAAFAEGPVFDWYSAGRIGVSIDDAKQWLEALTKDGSLPVWTDTVRTKVARGLLAAMRDFGILKGAVHKEFNTPGMTPKGFAYVAFREHQQQVSARALLESPIWRRWLLDDIWISDLLTQVDRLGLLHYSRAGSAVRIDWKASDLQEVVNVPA